MWDLRSNFPSYSVNFGGVNFLGKSIPLIFWENGVWYLKIGFIGTNLAVRATAPKGMMVLCSVVVVQLLSLACRLLSYFRLALSVLRRSMLEWAQLGNALFLLDATDFYHFDFPG